MLAARVRSGLEESFHDGVVAVSDPDAKLIASSGDVDRPFYLRSSAKPFQAFVSQEAGAALEPLELAMACASHRGLPVQLGLVESMLAKADLGQSHLGCPPDWPIKRAARDILIRRGEQRKRRLWHNCSGKHAGFLRACVAQGWPIDSYLDPAHPLQKRVVEFASELGELPVEPVGVDGCGAPVLRTTARAMSLLFARLGSFPELSQVYTAMHRYPSLIGANGEGDSTIATATNSVAKGGAEGCIGIGLASGFGVAIKSWDGLEHIGYAAAVSTLDAIGQLNDAARSELGPVARPPVLGGGQVQGHLESRLELTFG